MFETIVRKHEREVVDVIEKALDTCEHPHAREIVHPWCNVCGAIFIGGRWVKPHWRDVVAVAVSSLFVDATPWPAGREGH